MEQGTLGELYLTRSVIKHISKKNKHVIFGTAVGTDFAMLRVEGNFVCAEAVAENPYIAWVKAFNNLSVSGAEKIGARLVFLLPVHVQEPDIKDYMKYFNVLADKDDVQIMGGHSQVSHAYARASFCVTAYGQRDSLVREDAEAHDDKKHHTGRRKIEKDYDIVMAGYAGCLGARLIAEGKYAELVKHFSESYIDGFLSYNDDVSIDAAAKLMAENDVCCMHDVSWGGVYGALWQLGAAIKRGMRIDNCKLPIRQETVEICEYFNINPYLLDGTGGLLGVFADGQPAVKGLLENKIPAAVIGKVTMDKGRVVMAGVDERYLQPPAFDEIYKVLEAV